MVEQPRRTQYVPICRWPENGGDGFLRKIGVGAQNNTASKPVRLETEQLGVKIRKVKKKKKWAVPCIKLALCCLLDRWLC